MHPILLLHGLFGSLADSTIRNAFGTTQVLTPDLIGYGQNCHSAPAVWSLEDQADFVADWLCSRAVRRVHVVGHSVGGAVGVIFAHRHPTMTASLTSVEGNFTLGDAFWSQKISRQEIPEIAAEVEKFRADVPGWLARAGVPQTGWTITAGRAMLDNQPVSTLRSQARAVIAATGSPRYLSNVREIIRRKLPIHLVAGSRSRAAWNVPKWVLDSATSNTDIPGTGHLMMLEKPAAFAQTLRLNFEQ